MAEHEKPEPMELNDIDCPVCEDGYDYQIDEECKLCGGGGKVNKTIAKLWQLGEQQEKREQENY